MSYSRVIRINPPLNIREDEALEGLDILDEAMTSMAREWKSRVLRPRRDRKPHLPNLLRHLGAEPPLAPSSGEGGGERGDPKADPRQ